MSTRWRRRILESQRRRRRSISDPKKFGLKNVTSGTSRRTFSALAIKTKPSIWFRPMCGSNCLNRKFLFSTLLTFLADRPTFSWCPRWFDAAAKMCCFRFHRQAVNQPASQPASQPAGYCSLHWNARCRMEESHEAAGWPRGRFSQVN